MPNHTSKGYPYGADFNPRGNRIDTHYIVCHHNVSPNNRPDLPMAEAIVNLHMSPPNQGGRPDGPWLSGGYNDVIEQDGALVPLIHHAGKGAHIGRLNSHAYGVCIIGDGRFQGFFNEAQQRTLAQRIRELLKLYPDANVVGHRDVGAQGGVPSECPAYDFAAWWRAQQLPVGPDRLAALEAIVTRFEADIAAWRSSG